MLEKVMSKHDDYKSFVKRHICRKIWEGGYIMFLTKIDLQLFADLDEVFTQHADDIKDGADQFKSISAKLNELGYDVLLNNKEKAEFIPSSRLSEVVSERNNFRTKVEDLNKQLESLKNSSKGNEEMQNKLQEMMNENTNLLKDLEKTKVNSEIMVAAKDAINSSDVVAFINFDNIKVNDKGEVVGVEQEISRIREQKPYLFQTSEQPKKKGGTDPAAGGSGSVSGNLGMNNLIRKTAGRI